MKHVALLSVLALSLGGCVSLGTYHSVQAQLKTSTDQLKTTTDQLTALQKASDILKADNDRLATALKEYKSDYDKVSTKIKSLVDDISKTLTEADKTLK
jgi:uncharacterized phage infection (PIP) family protein YhgE